MNRVTKSLLQKHYVLIYRKIFLITLIKNKNSYYLLNICELNKLLN